MQTSSSLYASLKQSPLAKIFIENEVEEAAIWIDMQSMSAESLVGIFRAIENNYHQDTDKVYSSAAVFPPSSLRMAAQMATMPHVLWFSNRVLAWMFAVISKTSILDEAVLSAKFKAYATAAKERYRRQISSRKGNASTSQDLYEVFAELVGLIESKQLTKTRQSLLS